MSANTPGCWRDVALWVSLHFRAFGLRWAHMCALVITWMWCFFSVYGMGKHGWMGTPIFVNMVMAFFVLGILAVQGAEDRPPSKICIILLSCLCMTTTIQSVHKLSRALLTPDVQHIIRAAIPCATCVEFVTMMYIHHKIRPIGVWTIMRIGSLLAAIIPLAGIAGLRLIVGVSASYPPGDIPF